MNFLQMFHQLLGQVREGENKAVQGRGYAPTFEIVALKMCYTFALSGRQSTCGVVYKWQQGGMLILVNMHTYTKRRG